MSQLVLHLDRPRLSLEEAAGLLTVRDCRIPLGVLHALRDRGLVGRTHRTPKGERVVEGMPFRHARLLRELAARTWGYVKSGTVLDAWDVVERLSVSDPRRWRWVAAALRADASAHGLPANDILERLVAGGCPPDLAYEVAA